MAKHQFLDDFREGLQRFLNDVAEVCTGNRFEPNDPQLLVPLLTIFMAFILAGDALMQAWQRLR
jgi:hypothetical protein